MQIIPVELSKGSFIVRQNGKTLSFLGDGTTPTLSPGWTPIRILVGLPKLTVLQLQHDNGQLALWFLDSNFHFITNDAAMLAEEIRTAAIDQIPTFPDVPWEEIRHSSALKAILRKKKRA